MALLHRVLVPQRWGPESGSLEHTSKSSEPGGPPVTPSTRERPRRELLEVAGELD